MAQTGLQELRDEVEGVSSTVELLYKRIIALEEQNETVEGWIYEINQNHLEFVEALIEALNGVRLQGAQKYAIALKAKYFPPEEVVEEEVSTDTADTTITV